MTAADFSILLAKLRDRTISPGERQSLKDAVRSGEIEDIFKADILAQLESEAVQYNGWTAEKEKTILASILFVINAAPRASIFSIKKYWWVAASVFITLTTGVYFLLQHYSKADLQNLTQTQRLKNDIAPGANKAILTLGNGSNIILDSAFTGTIAVQGNATVVKTENGKLDYQASAKKNIEIIYNTLSTPRGGQYQLSLPDGSKAWLNAASSITYPTAFTGTERKVSITGEVYFEVTKDKTKPFYVSVGDMQVSVLGTHFNINSYGDEGAMKTTLLEGAVEIKRGSTEARLKPGEQAQVKYDGNIRVITDPDIEKTMAWKNNLFIFSGDDIKTIMRQLSRWYQVDVTYKGNLENRHFSGIINRNNNISQVLKLLESTEKIKFELEGNKITVMP